MTGPPAAVAAVRVAVRESLRTVPAGARILVACSGGADSLALAAAALFVRPGVGLVTVDHGLQAGSAERGAALADWAEREGFEPVRNIRVVVGAAGGPEAAARDARYAALDALAADVILLGHTRDDQAETVLLALARGAGPRGIAGMAARRGRYLRPLLGLPRAVVRRSCADLGLTPWEDPHNTDDRFARARVRELIATFDDRIVANLARTAALVAADTAELDRQAALVPLGESLPVALLADLPEAIRGRVLHRWARALGVPGADLSARHVAAVEALVLRWRGQGAVHLPGGVRVGRVGTAILALPR